MLKKKISNSELNRLTTEEFQNAGKLPVVIVLDNIRSHNNIGSVFRTADAFLVEAIYLCGITACPPHRDIHKTALGATETVTWKYFENSVDAVKELQSNGFTVFAVEQVEGAVSLDRLSFESGMKIALVFGHEINGVGQEVVNLSDFCIEIPQFGTKHSLNVAVSVGIVVWHIHFIITKNS